jgi:hypothetical protein
MKASTSTAPFIHRPSLPMDERPDAPHRPWCVRWLRVKRRLGYTHANMSCGSNWSRAWTTLAEDRADIGRVKGTFEYSIELRRLSKEKEPHRTAPSFPLLKATAIKSSACGLFPYPCESRHARRQQEHRRRFGNDGFWLAIEKIVHHDDIGRISVGIVCSQGRISAGNPDSRNSLIKP